MGKKKDLSPRKIGQIHVLLENTTLKQKEIANKLHISKQTVSSVKKQLNFGKCKTNSRVGKCGRKRITTERLDRKIKNISQNDRRKSCTKISMELAQQGIKVSRRTVNNRLLEQGLKAYRPRKKPRLTEKMKQARYEWAKLHENWTQEEWNRVIYV
jgi:DNA-directed RNA polymerase I, II, and III subunit RPABC1